MKRSPVIGIAALLFLLGSSASEAERLGVMAQRPPSLDRGTITKLVREYETDVRLCAAGRACALPASYLEQMKELRDLPRWEQLRRVDAWVNRFAYRTVNGPGDSVARFLREGGSCKEYVLTKLVMLRDLGFGLENLLPASVATTAGRSHEVLLVKIDGAIMVLNNYAAKDDPGPMMLASSPFNDYEAQWIVRVADGDG